MQSTILNGYDADELKLLEIFHPYAYKKTIDAFVNDQRFAHYTTADTAMRIIQGEEVWLRKSSCMNDFMEIEYGLECLQEAYKSNKDRLQTFFIDQYPDLCTKIEERFNAWLPTFRNETFLACLSEHDVREDRVGRLSMWRAYGGT